MKTHAIRNRWAGALAATTLTAVLTLTGCGVSTPDEIITPTAPPVGTQQPAGESGAEPPQPQAPQTEAPQTEAGQENGAGTMSVAPEDAARSALAAHPGSRVISVDLERNRGTTVWEVEVVSADAKFEVEIDASSGKTVKDEQERTSDLAKYNRRLDAAAITYVDVVPMVLDLHPGATLVEAELDDGHGGVVWEIDVVTPERVTYEIEIDAVTGKVLENRIDD